MQCCSGVKFLIVSHFLQMLIDVSSVESFCTLFAQLSCAENYFKLFHDSLSPSSDSFEKLFSNGEKTGSNGLWKPGMAPDSMESIRFY